MAHRDAAEVVAVKSEESALRTLCHLMRKMIHSQVLAVHWLCVHHCMNTWLLEYVQCV